MIAVNDMENVCFVLNHFVFGMMKGSFWDVDDGVGFSSF